MLETETRNSWTYNDIKPKIGTSDLFYINKKIEEKELFLPCKYFICSNLFASLIKKYGKMIRNCA